MSHQGPISQATLAQTIRTSKSLLWGTSIALSWTWGIGLFFSVQMGVQFGIQGLVSFAVANSLGLILFGFYTSRLARRRKSADALERTFFEGAKTFRGAIFFYQLLAIIVTMFALLRYLVMPLGFSPVLVCLVLFGVTFFLGEEFDIAKIKFSHAYAFLGVLLAMATLLLFVLPRVGWGGAMNLNGAWPIYDSENFEGFTYYMYYMVPVVVGFLLGPWLDLQQWQRAIQIRREGLSILGSYVCGAIIFFFILLFHGCLALAIWSGSTVDLVHETPDKMFHAKDVIVTFFLLEDNPASAFFGFYMAFLSLCAVTTFDSGYIALKWYLRDIFRGGKGILWSFLPEKLFTSPLPYFFFCGGVALAASYLHAELEYMMAFYGSFLVGYQVIFYRKMAFDLKGTQFPVMKLFSVSLFSIAIFGIGYFYLRPALMAIGAVVPLFYGGYLASAYKHRLEPLFAKPGEGAATTAADDSLEGDAEPVVPGGGAVAPSRMSAAGVQAGELATPGGAPAVAQESAPPGMTPAGRAPSTYWDGKWFVYQFTTTYSDTNSVGNVYFGQYAMWVGKARELFFFTVMPDFNLGNTDFYILTRAFEHKFLRETKEFEVVQVRLRIADYNRKFATLEHEVYDGSGQLLGKGKQTLLFVSSADYRILDIPDAAVKAFISYA